MRQNGFRRNHGTTWNIWNIYSMKKIHQIWKCKKLPLYLLFVNLTAQPYTEEMARNHNQFDSIRLQFPEGESVKLFNILGKLYQKTYLTYQEAQVTFLVTSGVCHRGPVSSWPIQFIY